MITLQDVAVQLADALEKGIKEGEFLCDDENCISVYLPESPTKLFGKYKRELQNLFREERLRRGMRKDLLTVLQVWDDVIRYSPPEGMTNAIFVDFVPSYGWVDTQGDDE